DKVWGEPADAVGDGETWTVIYLSYWQDGFSTIHHCRRSFSIESQGAITEYSASGCSSWQPSRRTKERLFGAAALHRSPVHVLPSRPDARRAGLGHGARHNGSSGARKGSTREGGIAGERRSVSSSRESRSTYTSCRPEERAGRR